MILRGAVVLLLLLAHPEPARSAGGAVKGSITAGDDRRAAADAVVTIDGPAAPEGAAPARVTVMEQRGETFVPHVLAVPVGTTVDFPNRDPMLHNVFSASPAKKFDLGMYGEGETRSVTFDAPGVVRIGCNAHPKMEAFVVVHPTPYVAVTDAQGGYTIGGLPAGRYRMRVWHERLGEAESPVIVTEGGVEHLNVRLRTRR
jgi:plastocyanin